MLLKKHEMGCYSGWQYICAGFNIRYTVGEFFGVAWKLLCGGDWFVLYYGTV
jgi:hypothetical protein